MPYKVVLCGTHPAQYNGYSKVVYYLAQHIGVHRPDIKLHIFGFQNFYDGSQHREERSLPENVEVFDAALNEQPKNKGFGEDIFVKYLENTAPDLVIIYNDIAVITTLLKRISTMSNKKFNIVPYIDLVYKSERNQMISEIHRLVDGGILFTKFWETQIKLQGFTKPTYVLEHGFDENIIYPVPKDLARKYLELPKDAFIVLNLNRNQPRKRWDICIMGFVKYLAENPNSKTYMLIGTNIKGSWDLSDVILCETRKYNMKLEDVFKRIIGVQGPQQLTDFDINIMYSAADVGLNTCDGEGFGLCNFEQALVGIPQIIPNIGGFRDFFDNTNALLLEPVCSIYGDHMRDVVGGEMELCSCTDVANAIKYAVNNPEEVRKLGEKARADIFSKYSWYKKGVQFTEIIDNIRETIPKREVGLVDKNTVVPVDINSMLNSSGNKNMSADTIGNLNTITPVDVNSILNANKVGIAAPAVTHVNKVVPVDINSILNSAGKDETSNPHIDETNTMNTDGKTSNTEKGSFEIIKLPDDDKSNIETCADAEKKNTCDISIVSKDLDALMMEYGGNEFTTKRTKYPLKTVSMQKLFTEM